MTPERWERIRKIFGDAVELPPGAARAAWLDRACGGDDGLRVQIEEMLALDEGSASVLDASPTALAEAVRPVQAEADPERAVGPYRIVRELGRGGMGTVYLAERADVGKRVALKVVRGDLAAPEYAERFVREQRVLARLEHPNIAALMDAGVTEDGTPWFAMELVAGEPIDRFCDARRLPLSERLALFTQACAAVQYAHQCLVIHRDLKPGNIVVDERGSVKLLDFGIAKLVEDGERDTTPLTGTGMRLLTPEYAAPEQLRGGPVTTATDGYALGVVLYELLSGHRPRPRGGRSHGEIERQVFAAEPPRPSSVVARAGEARRPGQARAPITPETVSAARRTTPAALQRALQGDLDTIVLKALEMEPARRYASAQQLLDDLERYRRGLPISARPATLGYRARTFVRRRRVGVAVAAVILALLAGVGFSLELRRTAAAHARLESGKAEQATVFLDQVFGTSDPRQVRGRVVSTPALLEWGERNVGMLGGQPAVQAQLLSRIGEAYVARGSHARATPLFERALQMRRALHADDHPDVAASLWWVALMRMTAADFDDALRLFGESLAMQRRLFGGEHPQVVEGLSGLAFAMSNRGDVRSAERVYREALALERRLASTPPRMIPAPLNGVAFSLLEQGRYTEAEPLAREALDRARAEQGEDHPFHMIALANLARALHGNGDLAEAELLFREAVELTHRVQGAEHPRLAVYLGWYASLLVDREDLPGAEALARRALDIQRAALPPRHYWTVPTLTTLGRILTDSGRPRAAEPLLRQAVAIAEQWLPPDSHELARARGELGACLAMTGSRAEAETLLDTAYAALRQTLGVEHPFTRRAGQHHQALAAIAGSARPVAP